MDAQDLKAGDLIGIYSPVMGSGKSEAARVLVEEFGYVVVKFAGPIKSMAAALLREMDYRDEVILEMVEGSLKEEPLGDFPYRLTPRKIMQTLGTEWGRDCLSSSIWTDIASQKISALLMTGHKVVVDDMRFLNEIHAVRKLGGRTLKITRPDVTCASSGHVSEGALDGFNVFDFWLRNDGSIADLRQKVRALAS